MGTQAGTRTRRSQSVTAGLSLSFGASTRGCSTSAMLLKLDGEELLPDMTLINSEL